ncbi:hypothetical protein ASG01_11290 [Chryseobacterium sp. Leaf180]|uniref:RDD family protein n=1 Tax=Chryseobacterium sp. Leaf180 TaxID=1736289 RepID=UPI0006F928C0|nr:RDD family protein [Chryseobacterium sp. Leaf180]KQR92495.1 hypothetical protein ASG01_11290 [Chryseobacterium sp. Leaf180]
MQELYSKKDVRIIGFSALVISILGILLSFKTYFLAKTFFTDAHEPQPFLQLYWVFKPILLFLGPDKTPFDVYEVFVCFMMLIGAAIFLKNKKDTRLIAFSMAVLLISNVTSLVNILMFIFFILPKRNGEAYSFFPYLYPVFNIAYAVLAFMILKKIREKKVLDTTVSETTVKISDTPKMQRFIHFFVDTLIMALVFMPVAFRVFEIFLRNNETFMRTFNESKLTLFLLLFICRFLYYPFFEIVFGSTPAKFLTESRVITSQATNPQSGNIFLRTLCRHIPFDAVSFFWKTGWHDRFSETYVVKEERVGFKTNKLLWFLLLLIPYLSFYYKGDDLLMMYTQMQSNGYMVKYEEDFRQNSVKNINTSQVFVLRTPIMGEYKLYMLKIEKVNGNEIICKKLVQDQTYSSNYFAARDIYQKQKDTAELVKIERQDFTKALTQTYGNTENPEKNGVDFFKNGNRYEIENIYSIASPYLENANLRYGLYNNSRDISGVMMTNNGKLGTLTKIKNISGNIKWENQLPMQVTPPESGQNGLYLKAKNIQRDSDFETDLYIRDSLNNQQIYRIIKTSGVDSQLRLFQLQ